MTRLACFVGALAAFVLLGTAGHVRAQGAGEVPPGVEVITEPPPQPEPAPNEVPVEPAPAETPTADTPPKVPIKKKKPGHLRVWGGIGLGFGADFISVGVAPAVSYIFKKIVEPGLAVRYEYSRDRRFVPNVQWHTVGGSLFVRLYPIPSLFAHIEGELINTGARQGDERFPRQTLGNLLLGGGFVQGVGRGAFVVTAIKVPVLRNSFYPTAFPIISVGAGYSF